MGKTKTAFTMRRLLLIIVATGVSIAGLGLLAGGGYMLVAGPSPTEPVTQLNQVSAQEPATATPFPTTVAATATKSLATATPTATRTPAIIAQGATPTATRVIKATPTATPDPQGTELPDTGFGEFLQPLAGAGLVGVALAAHAIRRRR